MNLTLLKTVLMSLLKTLVTKLLTEKFLMKLIVIGLDYLVPKDSNKLHYELVHEVKAALESSSK